MKHLQIETYVLNDIFYDNLDIVFAALEAILAGFDWRWAFKQINEW